MVLKQSLLILVLYGIPFYTVNDVNINFTVECKRRGRFVVSRGKGKEFGIPEVVTAVRPGDMA